MKNQWKSQPLFWVHRVYGIQNDRLDLTINEFLTVLKTLEISANLSNEKTWKIVNFSCFDALFFRLLKTRLSWDQDSRFEYHKPYGLKKVGDYFFMEF